MLLLAAQAGPQAPMPPAPLLTGLGGRGGDRPPRLQGHARGGKRRGKHGWLLAAFIGWGGLHKRAAEPALSLPQQFPLNAAPAPVRMPL